MKHQQNKTINYSSKFSENIIKKEVKKSERSQQILELTWIYFLMQIYFTIQTFSPFPKLIIESFCIRKLVVDMIRKKGGKVEV